MEQKILTEWQEKIIGLVMKSPELCDFYLSGGTALAAYYLHHRYSDDLDFFTEKNINPKILYKFMEKAKKIIGVRKKGVFLRFEKMRRKSLGSRLKIFIWAGN